MRSCWLIILSFLMTAARAQSFPPSLHWQYSFGGSRDDQGNDIQPTPDGGFITAGYTNSTDGDITLNKGQSDAWIVKCNAAGSIEWQKTFGGSSNDELVKIKVLSGGGYLAIGNSTSSDGDIAGSHGGDDIWLLRLDNNGNLLWQKCLGGSLNEFAGSVEETATGGIIVCGNTTSHNGDVSGIHPGLSNLGDTWVACLDGAGNLLWQHCYGGSQGESVGIIKATTDGGYTFASYSSSSDGDVSPTTNGDIWLVHINSTGTILWQKCLGGNMGETPYDLVELADGYAIAGITLSDDAQHHYHGGGDAYVVRTDAGGNLLWQKFLGGADFESANAICTAADGGFYVAVSAKSADGNLCKNLGAQDYWIVKLSNTGNLEWQKSAGGTGIDQPYAIKTTADGSLLVNGSTGSNDNDVIGNHGAADQWVVKLVFPGTPLIAGVSISASANNVCPGTKIIFTALPVNGGTEPIYRWFVNNVEQVSATTSIFSSSSLQNGDIVSCQIKSSLTCIDQADAVSNTIQVQLDLTGAPAHFLTGETTICEGVPQQLTAAPSFASYLWSTGATTASVSINTSGTYWVEVPYNNNLCRIREYITVAARSCNQKLYLPSAFTPNKDGKNDLFKPVIYGLASQYKLSVYNRWGQLVFTTADPDSGWDGTWNNKLQEGDVFIWVCTYKLSGEPVRTDRGTVVVIR